MSENKQVLVRKFTDREMELIKIAFKDNDSLLMAMRNVMLQLPLNAMDLSALEVGLKGKKDLLKVLRRHFLPQLEGTTPIEIMFDMWMSLPLESKHPGEAIYHIEAREKAIAYTDQQMKVLESGDYQEKQEMSFERFTDISNLPVEDKYASLLARNSIVTGVQYNINQLKLWANMKEESPTQKQERLEKDSSR